MTDFQYTDIKGFDSTALELAAYNVFKQELLIRFVSGAERVYEKVPDRTFYDLCDAYSAGRFYNTDIAGQYPSLSYTDGLNLLYKEPVVVASNPQDVVSDDSPMVDDGEVKPFYEYGVKYTIPGTAITASASFDAYDEAHALEQFAKAITVLGVEVNIRAVTRYFD